MAIVQEGGGESLTEEKLFVLSCIAATAFCTPQPHRDARLERSSDQFGRSSMVPLPEKIALNLTLWYCSRHQHQAIHRTA